VGGDGVFQEILNGILAVRGAGGFAGELAAHMRLGHIPAGSTDAVACSLNGTRCPATAALHIALGDRCLPCCPVQSWVAMQVTD
jgi:ceramide kinase